MYNVQEFVFVSKSSSQMCEAQNGDIRIKQAEKFNDLSYVFEDDGKSDRNLRTHQNGKRGLPGNKQSIKT